MPQPKTEPEELGRILETFRLLQGQYRDGATGYARLQFEPVEDKHEAVLMLRDERFKISTPCLRRISGHLKAPYSYLRKFPRPQELAEHLSALAAHRPGSVIVRCIGPKGSGHLRGFMKETRTPLDTYPILQFSSTLLEQLSQTRGILVESTPEPDGSRNRARLSIRLGRMLSSDPPIEATLDLINDECAAFSTTIGFRHSENEKTGSIVQMTKRVEKRGKPFDALRKCLRAMRKAVKQLATVEKAFEEGRGMFGLEMRDLSRVLTAARIFPEGYAELLALEPDEENRSQVDVLLTMCQAAKGLPERLRKECERKAWALFLTGFRSVTAFGQRGTSQGRAVQL